MTAQEAAEAAAEADRWTATHQAALNRLLTAEAQQHPSLPTEWQVWADAEPEPSRLHTLAFLILINTAALLVLLVVGRIVWQGISTAVGL